jgi:hypothetical protein
MNLTALKLDEKRRLDIKDNYFWVVEKNISLTI